MICPGIPCFLAKCIPAPTPLLLLATSPLKLDRVSRFHSCRGKESEGVIGYGALGVGDTKMKLHRLAVSRLFKRNDLRLDAEEVYALAQTLP